MTLRNGKLHMCRRWMMQNGQCRLFYVLQPIGAPWDRVVCETASEVIEAIPNVLSACAGDFVQEAR